MKYIKYIILALAILIIITIVIILNIMHNGEYVYTDEIEEEVLPIDLIKEVSVLESRNNYYIVKKIIENYYYDLAQFNMKAEDVLILETEDNDVSNNALEQSVQTEIQAYKNKVYSYLASEYKEKNNLTLNNIQEKLGNYNNPQVMIDNIYYLDSNEDVRIYFVYGNVIEKETLKKEQFKIMLSVDSQNSAFEIYPSGYDYNVEVGKELNIDKEKIENVVYNSYKFEITDDETFAKELFNDYKNRLMYDVESAYEHLDDEYKAKKVENIDEFKNYIKNNYYSFINANMVKYQIKYSEEYTQVICTDRNENNYIFKVKEIANYSIIPDTYTIDIPEFVEKYEKSTDQEKVILNINKIKLALNDKDYKYIYSKLADSFKTNTFTSYDLFERYMKALFFDENEFEYKEFGNEGGTYYTYKVEIKDRTNTNNNVIEKTFIMLLEEGTDFKISFNLK